MIFDLYNLSIDISKMLKTPTIFVLLLNFLFVDVSICVIHWGSLMLGANIFYNCYISYIFFLDWSLDHYVASFFVSCKSLCFKAYFVLYGYCYSRFPFISISIPSVLVCVPRAEMSLFVDCIYMDLVFISIQLVCVF